MTPSLSFSGAPLTGILETPSSRSAGAPFTGMRMEPSSRSAGAPLTGIRIDPSSGAGRGLAKVAAMRKALAWRKIAESFMVGFQVGNDSSTEIKV